MKWNLFRQRERRKISKLKSEEKFFVILFVKINSTSQTRINVYTLIVKKDFRICERGKK